MNAGQDASSDPESTSSTRTDETTPEHGSDADETTPEHGSDADETTPEHGSDAGKDPFDERDLQPAVRRRNADGRDAGRPDADPESVTEVLSPSGPLEPQEINPENAAFVLFGVLLVVGLVVGAIAGF
jgi:hypothetical protein